MPDELTFVRNEATVIQLTIIISSRFREAACDRLITTLRMITIILTCKTPGSSVPGRWITANVCNVENDSVSCADRNNNQLSSICAKRRRRNRTVEKAGSVAGACC